jgi:group I intron endonuclease
MYIGSTKDLRQRLWKHWSDLRLDKHQVNTLKTDFDEIGRGGFRILVFEELLPGLTRKQREDKEQEYVNIYWDSGVLYNLRKSVKGGCSFPGKKHSAESRAKMSAAGKGKTAWNKGKKTGPRSDETKAKMSAANKHPAWQYTDEIKALRITGLPYSKISERYNCHDNTIRNICLSDNLIAEPVLEAL